jgi:5,6,7,8-tetrahydromethanopterin hydro-lyase
VTEPTEPTEPTQFGEAFVGEGAEAAHLNTVLGACGGPVETAWVTALATPRQGHAGFVVAVQPGLAVRPFTLFVNKAPIADERHGTLTWGAAQAGVAGGVLDAVADAIIDPALANELLLIAAVWVNPEARDEQAVYRNNREATRDALAAGRDQRPGVGEAVAAREHPRNAYFGSGGAGGAGG